MNFADEDRENRLEELKNNIITHHGKIEEAERNHTVSKATLEAWRNELKKFGDRTRFVDKSSRERYHS